MADHHPRELAQDKGGSSKGGSSKGGSSKGFLHHTCIIRPPPSKEYCTQGTVASTPNEICSVLIDLWRKTKVVLVNVVS